MWVPTDDDMLLVKGNWVYDLLKLQAAGLAL